MCSPLTSMLRISQKYLLFATEGKQIEKDVNAYISSEFIAYEMYSCVLVVQVEPATLIPLATRCKQVFLVNSP